MQINLFESIRIFIEIVESGSFTQAAENLQIHRPAVTKALQLLEQHCGTRLMQRTTRRINLTPDGEALAVDRDAAIAAFAARVARDAPHIDDTEREALRAHGLSDADIFDVILAVAARCFFSTVLDATGTRADASYRERLPVDLVTELTCGREPL